MEKIQLYAQQFLDTAVVYLPKLLLALATLVVGWWIIDRLARLAYGAMSRLDVSLRTFLTSIVRLALRALLVITVAGMVGFQTTSFIAILGAASLAVGLALQGTLANFAGGVLILLFKPYVVGDSIEVLGKTGKVKEIQIFNTILLTGVGETVILPNGAVSNSTIVNLTTEGRVLVEVQLEVAMQTSINDLRAVLLPSIVMEPRILKDPAPGIGIASLKSGSMVVSCKVHTTPADSGAVQAYMVEQIRETVLKYNIGGPVPVTHTYVHNVPAPASQT